MCVCAHVRVHVHVCVHVCVYMCMHVYVCVCVVCVYGVRVTVCPPSVAELQRRAEARYEAAKVRQYNNTIEHKILPYHKYVLQYYSK